MKSIIIYKDFSSWRCNFPKYSSEVFPSPFNFRYLPSPCDFPKSKIFIQTFIYLTESWIPYIQLFVVMKCSYKRTLSEWPVDTCLARRRSKTCCVALVHGAAKHCSVSILAATRVGFLLWLWLYSGFGSRQNLLYHLSRRVTPYSWCSQYLSHCIQ